MEEAQAKAIIDETEFDSFPEEAREQIDDLKRKIVRLENKITAIYNTKDAKIVWSKGLQNLYGIPEDSVVKFIFKKGRDKEQVINIKLIAAKAAYQDDILIIESDAAISVLPVSMNNIRIIARP